MRIYRGKVYEVWLAVYPTSKGVYYLIMDVEDGRKRKDAYVKCGYDRELKVKENAKLIMHFGKKTKILKIPFEKVEDKWTFDLPKYLSDNKIRFKLRKRDLTNCRGTEWNHVAYISSICKNGQIFCGSDRCIDYYEYWIIIEYSKNFPCVSGKNISNFDIKRTLNPMDTEEILGWFENSMEKKVNTTWKELGIILDKLGIDKTYCFFEIKFCDGTSLQGNEIDWDEEELKEGGN